VATYCEDCGTQKHGGICPYCQEELYILAHQAEDVDEVSDEFAAKAQEQAARNWQQRKVSQ
jgi:hypothetical protein